MKKVILFGCGRIGIKAISLFGEDNVECFCDNNPSLVGRTKCEKRVISFEELRQNMSDEIVVICADKGKEITIAKQCEKNGIRDYVTYEAVCNAVAEKTSLSEFIENPFYRMRARNALYLLIISQLERQIDYFKRHVDIRQIKPAVGKLRERQLRIVEVSADFLKEIKELGIQPFLYAGNLLGYIRHGGFIPWDDDIDFALFRKDYEKLKRYCEKVYSKENFAMGGKFGWMDFGDHFAVGKMESDGQIYGIDFFLLDYYEDDYSYIEFREYVNALQEELIKVQRDSKQFMEMIEKARQENGHIVEESSQIYFGIDNMDLFLRHDKGCWMSRDIIFPLRKILFENREFYIPNHPEEFLGYIYPDITEFPQDIGLPKHLIIEES